MNQENNIPSISMNYANNGKSTSSNELGMRAMQERAYERRGEQFLLIKSPPASGKSRALMFIALDKLHHQGMKKAIIAVPEKSIGSSFNDEPLQKFGFYYDWQVEPKWNLCNAPGEDGSKVKSVESFLQSDDNILICTHATFRFAFDKMGVEAFDDCLIAIDEFHHVSANEDNRLGAQLKQLIEREKVHIVAMTGSYFRGDAEPVLEPSDEAKFDTVTYTYYEQLNGYQYLKQLDIGYYFYENSYIDEILGVLTPHEKTIIHIPNVNSRESTKRGKDTEVSEILGMLGEWKGKDELTGFDLVETKSGKIIKIADLVDDGPDRHSKVLAALKDPDQKDNKDHVDMIIALGMAKEGFDWIWCEHALTIGYRSSLTEIIQIIGRATRDAKGKKRSRFTNLIASPTASEDQVKEAVNDTLKAVAASLLMEQVLAPKFNFKMKNTSAGPNEGFDYGEDGYQNGQTNIGFSEETGEIELELKGLIEPKSDEAKRVCEEDINEIIASFVQDKVAVERGIFDDETVAEEITQLRFGKIIKESYPQFDEEDQEAIRQRAVAAFNLTQAANSSQHQTDNDDLSANTAFVDGVRKFAMDVRELNIELIDQTNPFGQAYAILSKSMNEKSLKEIADIIAGKKVKLSLDEARALAKRALKFKQERGELPNINSPDPWERKMAEGIAFLARLKSEAQQNG